MEIKGNINAGYGNTLSTSTKSSVIGGSNNSIISGATYSVIGGGKNNTVSGLTNSYSSIVGGRGNEINPTNFRDPYGESCIGGGRNNIITAYQSFIGSGISNKTNASRSFIGGGNGNYIERGSGVGSRYGIIVGGLYNNIGEASAHSFIGCGNSNAIGSATTYSNIVGGRLNKIYTGNVSRDGNFIGGGIQNVINESSPNSSIIGGQYNTINHANAHIIGSNITSISANTTHVQRLNIGTLNGTTPSIILALDVNGQVVNGASLAGVSIVTVAGTGTTNTLPKWSSTTGLTDSTILDDGTDIYVYTTEKLRRKTTYDFGTVTGGTISWDLSTHGFNSVATLAGTGVTISITAQTGDYGTIVMKQNGTGGYNVGLPAGSIVSGGGGGFVYLTPTASAIDLLNFYYDGTNYFWSAGYDYN